MSLSSVSTIRIHPGIGIARLGNSSECFIGPEAPGIVSDPGGSGGPGPDGGKYKDARQRMKRQAQRFRVYGYDAQGGVVMEIDGTTTGVAEIEWRVHVRNMKAANYAFQGAYLFDPKALRNPSIQPGMEPIQRDKLIIDPGPRTISKSSPSPVSLAGGIFEGVGPNGDGTGLTLPGYLQFHPPPSTPPSQDVAVTYHGCQVELGELRLDEAQRLLFVPATGESQSVTQPAVVITNPSEHHDPPNGPVPTDPLTNQFSYFNVPGWYDDTCGGSVDVTITLSNGTTLSTLKDSGTESPKRDPGRGAWVVVAPPKYSPWMYHVVSILDRVYEVYPDADPTHGLPTEFYRDIYPILAEAVNYAWVSAEAFGPQGTAHGPGQPGDLLLPENLSRFESPAPEAKAARMGIYNIMRVAEDDYPPPPPAAAPPARPAGQGPASRGNLMPKLWGTGGKPLQNLQLDHNLPNQYLSLTAPQLARLQDWANGNFTPGTKVEPKPLEEIPLAQQPHAMDAAALQPTIGGGFHPGIEFPYLIRYQDFFAGAFRVAADVEPGSLAAFMSSPWQGDFWSCNTAWWPVQRPDIVVEYEGQRRKQIQWFRGYDWQDGAALSEYDGYDQMVRVWWQLGMVVPSRADDVTGRRDVAGRWRRRQPVLRNRAGLLSRLLSAVGFKQKVDQGEPVFRETERDPALDHPPARS